METEKYCKCGCGIKVKIKNSYVNGHNNRNKKHSLEWCNKISRTNKKIMNQPSIKLLLTKLMREIMAIPENKIKHKKALNSIEVKLKMILSHLGEKSHFWRGGISFIPYTKDFNSILKNRIRKRDNQVCMNCGVHREKLKQALHIHHINYDKNLSIPENLVSLCIRCHASTHFNRKYWTKLFQDKLSKLYGYQYTKEGDIKMELEEIKWGI